jgi:hypothetical protein
MAWFLRLQRILRFPKAFLAPSSAALLRVKSGVRDPIHDRLKIPFSTTNPVIRTLLSRDRAPAHQRSEVSFQPAAWLGRSPAGVTPTTPLGIHRGFKRHGASESDSGGIVARSTFLHPPSIEEKLQLQYYPERREQGPLEPTADQQMTPRAFHLKNGVQPAVRDMGSWTSPSRLAGSFSRITNTNALLRASPPPTADEGGSEQSTRPDSHSEPDVLKTDAHFDQQQSKSPSASTIHIDGSVLGRWAIRHLERTLAKPASGMTGVDPRASLPRGRVSPF